METIDFFLIETTGFESRSNAAAASLSLSFSLSNRVLRSVRSGKRLLLAAVTFLGSDPLTIQGVGELLRSTC